MRTAINAQSPSARTSGVTPDDGRRQIASPVDRNSFRSPCGERERDRACPGRFNLYENRYNLVERYVQSTGVRSLSALVATERGGLVLIWMVEGKMPSLP